jgi:hypothetical protein
MAVFQSVRGMRVGDTRRIQEMITVVMKGVWGRCVMLGSSGGEPIHRR